MSGAGVAQSVFCLNCGLDDQAVEVRSPAEARDFFLCAHTGSGAHSNILYNGNRRILSPGVKRGPGRHAGHSPPSSSEVMNE
jgi:hypothetical protein